MLPIYELVGPDGALALLGKKGYSIQNPTDGAALETRTMRLMNSLSAIVACY